MTLVAYESALQRGFTEESSIAPVWGTLCAPLRTPMHSNRALGDSSIVRQVAHLTFRSGAEGHVTRALIIGIAVRMPGKDHAVSEAIIDSLSKRSSLILAAENAENCFVSTLVVLHDPYFSAPMSHGTSSLNLTRTAAYGRVRQ